MESTDPIVSEKSTQKNPQSNWDHPITTPFGSTPRPVRRLYTTEHIDAAIAEIIEKVSESIVKTDARVGMVAVSAVWKDDFYAQPTFDIHGQLKSPKRDRPIYLAISCALIDETLLCEPSSLPAGRWWKQLLPLMTHEKIVKVFWDGRILMTSIVKNIMSHVKQQDEDLSAWEATTIRQLRQNCLVIALALIIQRVFVDTDPARSSRRIMRLPEANAFLPNHADPVERMLLQTQTVLVSGIDAAGQTNKRKKQWHKLLRHSEIFLTVDKSVRIDPLPYVPLDVFHSENHDTGDSQSKKFQRFMVHCVDCRRNVPTSLTDPVNITIHGKANETGPKLPSKSPGNVYAAYRCRVCTEVIRPCPNFKEDKKCMDSECVNIKMLLYCPAGALCCDHTKSKTCPFTHPDEVDEKWKETIDEWGAPRVYLGMPSWNADSYQCVERNDGKKQFPNRQKGNAPSLYKVPCPDHFSAEKCSLSTRPNETKSPVCPFAHEKMPVFIGVPVPIQKDEAPKGGDFYCRDFARFGNCRNAEKCERVHAPPHIVDTPSLSLEEFAMYHQNMKSELEKLVHKKDNEVHSIA